MKRITLLLTLICITFGAYSCSKRVQKETLKTGGILHIYTAKESNGTMVVMCPGGGYDHLAINHEGHDMAKWFNEQGINYAVLEYRIPKEAGDTLPMIDAHEALSYLTTNADKYGIDVEKIGIMGASAGGHLASHIANTDSRIAFQILLYPVISMNDTIGHGGSRKNLLGSNVSQSTKDRYSNDKLVSATTPPAYIVLSANDRDVLPANSINYFEALNANGIPAELHIFPSGGHGWGFRDSFPHKREWLSTMAAWLKKFPNN